MKVLVATDTDACCGPMAAAFLRDYSPRLEVLSAGRNPMQTIDPLVIIAMHECLIDLEQYQPRHLDLLDVSSFDVVFECSDLPCPSTLQECRCLRDYIKNEAFLFFRRIM